MTSTRKQTEPMHPQAHHAQLLCYRQPHTLLKLTLVGECDPVSILVLIFDLPGVLIE